MSNDLKQDLVNRLKQIGAYDVRVANPHRGFEHALPGKHPLELWPECGSVIVLAVARSPKANNIYAGPFAPWQGRRMSGPVPPDIQSDEQGMVRLAGLFLAFVRLEGLEFLQTNGHNVSFLQPQLKLSAFEAGIGVYGRSGLIIHPALGNRIVLGAIMTNAVLEPDGRLEGFEPCQDCDLCIEMCPAGAFDSTKQYPHSWSRETCTAKRIELAHRELYCHNCFAACPVGALKDEELLCIKEAESFFEHD
jgi:ferredoxin